MHIKENFRNSLRIIFVSFLFWGTILIGSSYANSFSDLVKNNFDGSQTLTGHVPPEVKNGKAAFQYHASQNISARIILPLQNQIQLSSLLHDLYDPTSPGFHQFITPTQFAQQFGSSAVDVQLIQSFLNKQGITVTGQSQNGTVLTITGPVAAFEHAFGLHINHYQKTDGTLFFAPDADPTIPATLAGRILAIGGLDNLAKYQPHFHQVPQKAATNALAGKANVGTGPGGYLTPNDVKTAYNLNSISSTGVGQSVALFELDGYTPSDITAYDAQFNLPGVPLQNIPIDGFSGYPDYGPAGSAPEVDLDIELVTAFAPGLSNILVYEAANTTQAWIDEWTRIATDNKAKAISCSWGGAEVDSPTTNFDNMIFQQMAAQGQAVFVAAGDSGAYVNGVPSDEPAVQPFATAVGISTLTTNANGTYNSETASGFGGGGISAYQTIPFYQTIAASQAIKAAMVSTTMRNVPDVVLTADASTAYAFYINGNWSGYYGSSLSSPIWASFISLVNQGLGINGPLGFANPLFYKIAQSSSYTNDFHDITTGNNSNAGTTEGYPAEPGFDDATGLGSFNGLNLYNDLINQVNLNPVGPPSAPVGLNATAGNGQVVLTWSSSAGAASYIVKRATVSGGPYTTIGSPVTFNTFYNDNAVSKGYTYYYVVSAVNSKGQSANSVQVSATPTFLPPPAPTGLVAAAGNGQVVLTWNASTGATSYSVARLNGSQWTWIATYLPQTTYTDSTATPGITYYYGVVAINAGGISPSSNLVSATPLAPSIPPVPSNINAGPGNNQVILTWSPSVGATSYNVKRSTVSGGPYTTIATLVTTVYNTGTPIYTDNSVSNGTTYYYVVSAVNAVGQSANSTQASVMPAPPPITPTGLNASSGSNGVVLTWNPSAGAYGYDIKRSTVNGGPYLFIASYAPTTFTDNIYTDTVVYGTTYYYVVSAVNIEGQQSANSVQISATFSVSPPSTPAGLQAIGSNAQVTLSWNASTGATQYSIYRSTVSGGPYTNIGSTLTNTNFTDTSVSSPTTYYYVVSASNAGGKSSNSAQVSATPLPPIIPPAPVGLAASAGNVQVILTWSGNASAASYNVKRSTVSGGPYTTIANVLTNTNYADNAVNNNTTYYYVVSAVNSVGESPNSAQVSATPEFEVPPVPIFRPSCGFLLSAIFRVEALCWSESAGATSYNIGRSTVSGGPYTTIANSAVNSYFDNSAVNGTTYYYVVSALNSAGQSANSAQLMQTPEFGPPLAPTGLIATAGNAQVTLSWTASTGGVTSYYVGRSTGSGGPYTTIGNSGTNTNFIDKTVTNGNTYYYVVFLINSAGQSPISTQVSATPLPPPSPDGSVLNVPSSGNLVTTAGVWTFGSTVAPAGNAILLNGSLAANGYGITMLVYNKGQLYVNNNEGMWWLWSGSGWTSVSGDPRISPDGSTLANTSKGSLVTTAGTWTFGSTVAPAGNAILLNGNLAANGYGTMMLVYNKGQLYVNNSEGMWWLWSGSGWTSVSGDPRT